MVVVWGAICWVRRLGVLLGAVVGFGFRVVLPLVCCGCGVL